MIRDKITDEQRKEAEGIFIHALGANFQTSFNDETKTLMIAYQWGPNYQVNFWYIQPDGTTVNYDPEMDL
jgi:hypothetical protein